MKVSGYYIYCIISMFVVIVVPTNCTSGDVQLMNGSSDSEGIVEVCYQGVWTTVDWVWMGLS